MHQSRGSPVVSRKCEPIILEGREAPMGPLVVRIWRTGLDELRAPEYEDFALSISLPMFRRHSGFLGVLFAGTGAERAVITLWTDRAAAAALDASADYQATVRAIEATGFLRPPQRLELLDVHGSWTEPLGQDPG
jgi:hypothetical protein